MDSHSLHLSSLPIEVCFLSVNTYNCIFQTIALWDRDPYRWELELELRRLRISFSKNKFDQVDNLSKLNGNLAKLLKTNDELAPLRKRRQTGPNAPLLRKIQDHACHLHTALEDAWGCIVHSHIP